jgi:serine/threonine protein kinase
MMQDIYPEGHLLLNRFEILSLLRSSELSQAYLALDGLSQKQVVVKRMASEDGESRNGRIRIERLMIEAQILHSLDNPLVVRYVHSWADRQAFSLVTEYVNSRSMRVVYGNSPPDRETIIEYTLQLLEVTEYLHSKGIIHRDIKPSNILLGDNIVLIDFNASEAQFVTFPRNQVVIGTPGYQCPESFRGVVSDSCDIFAIGGTLLFLLTGKDPAGDLAGFRNLSPYLDLLGVAFKALDPNQANRFSTASDMKQKLLSVAKRQCKLVCGATSGLITKDRFLIGRSDEADFKIVDPDKFVSPIHAEIRKVRHGFCILDKSINGTYVYRNGRYLKVSTFNLLDGDIIVLCYNPARGPHRIIKFRNILS